MMGWSAPVYFKNEFYPIQMHRIVLLVLFLPLAAMATAQTSANAVFNRAWVETGDTFSLRVLVGGVQTAPQKVDFSTWENILPSENILAHTAWYRSGGRWVQQFTLIAFDSATLQLPALPVRLHLGDSLLTNPLQITIRPTSAEADLRTAEPVRDICRTPTDWTDYWLEALTLSAFLALIGWYFFRKKSAPAPPIAAPLPPPDVSPQERALQKLAILEKQKLWKHGKTVQFYAELSFVTREFLEKRYRIPALESTTREIMELLKSTDFPSKSSVALRDLLQEADLAKYSERAPPEHACESAVKAACQWVLAQGE